MIIGECLHLVGSFICSDKIHQNYPCPYGHNIDKCPHSIKITEKMKEQFEQHGCVTLSKSELKYNPLD